MSPLEMRIMRPMEQLAHVGSEVERAILRGREKLCRLFFDESVPPDSARGLRKYFLAFATAARR